LELSNEAKAYEIHEKADAYYRATEKFAYKFLMEVKTIRDEKLYKTLGFDDFEEYTLKNFGYTRETISNRIQDAEIWGENYDEALRHYGKTKARQLGMMPEKDREEAIDKGIETDSGIKSVDEATTREIESYKKKNKQQEETIKEQERKLKQAKRSEEIAIEKLEKEQNKEPEVVTETKEVVPDDYKDLEESERKLRVKAKRSDEEIGRLKEKIQRMEKLEADKEEVERVKSEIKQLDAHKEKANRTLEAHRKLKELEKEFNEFFDSKMAPLKYKPLVNDLQGFNGTDRIKKLVNLARAWVEDMDQMLPAENRKIIEGEIVNE